MKSTMKNLLFFVIMILFVGSCQNSNAQISATTDSGWSLDEINDSYERVFCYTVECDMALFKVRYHEPFPESVVSIKLMNEGDEVLPNEGSNINYSLFQEGEYCFWLFAPTTFEEDLYESTYLTIVGLSECGNNALTPFFFTENDLVGPEGPPEECESICLDTNYQRVDKPNGDVYFSLGVCVNECTDISINSYSNYNNSCFSAYATPMEEDDPRANVDKIHSPTNKPGQPNPITLDFDLSDIEPNENGEICYNLILPVRAWDIRDIDLYNPLTQEWTVKSYWRSYTLTVDGCPFNNLFFTTDQGEGKSSLDYVNIYQGNMLIKSYRIDPNQETFTYDMKKKGNYTYSVRNNQLNIVLIN